MTHPTIDPTTGQTIATHSEITTPELRRALAGAHKAFLHWRDLPFTARAEPMRAAAGILRDRVRPLAELMAREMGKPVSQGRSEVEKCAWVCDFYAEHAGSFLASEEISTEHARSYVTFRPLGVIFAIMPWNFPLWQVFRAAAPALMGGNGMVLKHAENVPGCAEAIEEVFREAGFPARLFQNLAIGRDRAKLVIRHRKVAAVTLTGSTAAGKAVAKEAGARLKKCVLELGGSDPYLILADADLDRAVEAGATSRLINAGQSCIAAKRFLVVERVRADFERRLVDRMSRVRMGNPLQESTELGPLARADLRETLHEQVDQSVGKGARLLLGGVMPEGPGFFYPPTVLTDVRKGMPAYCEELFGPVAAIIPVPTAAAAVRVANDSPFGLGAAVFTGNTARGEEIAATKLEAGSCFVNDFVRSDPRLPFGGIKESGFGRELGRHGMLELQNVKTVVVG